MTAPFTTTGRKMSRRLQSALDDIDKPAQTAAVLEEGAAAHEGEQPDFGKLMRAIAFELRLRVVAEAATLHDLEADLRNGQPDGPPLPQAEGSAWWPNIPSDDA